MVIFSPIIILQPQPPLLAATSLIAIFVVVLVLQVVFVGYYFTALNPFEMAIAGLSAAALITFLVSHNYILLITGLMLCVFLSLWQVRVRRKGMEASKVLSSAR